VLCVWIGRIKNYQKNHQEVAILEEILKTAPEKILELKNKIGIFQSILYETI